MTERSVRRSSRREVLAGLCGLAVGPALGAGGGWLALRPRDALGEAATQAVPPEGQVLPITLDHAIPRLVAAGVVAPDKFRRLYAPRGGLPDWVGHLFEAPSEEPIRFSAETVPYLLNLLWAVGLATKAGFNARSPLAEGDPDRFASTGGWLLGRAERGGTYFNQVETVALNPDQEALVLAAAEAIFRPCCNNSTFFQDCNHGSAVLGLLELGAAVQSNPPQRRGSVPLAHRLHALRTSLCAVAGHGSPSMTYKARRGIPRAGRRAQCARCGKPRCCFGQCQASKCGALPWRSLSHRRFTDRPPARSVAQDAG
jgi:hypothetical protein